MIVEIPQESQESNDPHEYKAKVDHYILTKLEQREFTECDMKDGKEVVCAICMDSFVLRQTLSVFQCNKEHFFHYKCAVDWLHCKSQCPLCRCDFSEQIHSAFVDSTYQFVSRYLTSVGVTDLRDVCVMQQILLDVSGHLFLSLCGRVG